MASAWKSIASKRCLSKHLSSTSRSTTPNHRHRPTISIDWSSCCWNWTFCVRSTPTWLRSYSSLSWLVWFKSTMSYRIFWTWAPTARLTSRRVNVWMHRVRSSRAWFGTFFWNFKGFFSLPKSKQNYSDISLIGKHTALDRTEKRTKKTHYLIEPPLPGVPHIVLGLFHSLVRPCFLLFIWHVIRNEQKVNFCNMCSTCTFILENNWKIHQTPSLILHLDKRKIVDLLWTLEGFSNS